jgi:hypothetical protein
MLVATTTDLMMGKLTMSTTARLDPQSKECDFSLTRHARVSHVTVPSAISNTVSRDLLATAKSVGWKAQRIKI